MRESTTLVLGIGAPKAGTTWLACYFDDHPQFFMSPLKELHYFDAKYLPEQCGYFDHIYTEALLTLARTEENIDHVRMRVDMIDNERLYLAYFDRYMHDERCCGEISPAYCLLGPEAIRHIAGLHPQVKFIYILRNPVDRFLSHAFYMVHTLDMEFRNPDRYVRSALRSHHLQSRSDYRAAIENYDQGAPGHVLYLFYERLFCDATMRRVCDFCGIDFRPGAYAAMVNPRKSNASSRISEATRREVYRRLAGQYAFAAGYFQKDLPACWLEDMERFGR